MPSFTFVAQQGGQLRRGRVEAAELFAARARLERDYDRVLTLEVDSPAPAGPKGRIPTVALALSVRQFATMLKAGLPIHRCLDSLTRGDCPALNRVFESVGEALAAGLPLSACLARHPEVFTPYFLTLIRAGELSGTLDRILDKLADSLERQAALQQKLWSSLTYPALSLALAGGVILLLIYGVIPVLRPIFDTLGMELPWLTRAMLAVHSLATSLPFLAGLVLVGLVLVVVFRTWFSNTQEWQGAWRRLVARVPVLGPLSRKIAMANLLYALASMLESGVQIMRSFQVLETLDTDAELQKALSGIRSRVQNGATVAEAVQAAGAFPAMLVGMLRVGEESGHLDDMLRRTAAAFELDVEHAQGRLVALTEPLVLALLGGVTGLIVMAAILPILRLLSSF